MLKRNSLFPLPPHTAAVAHDFALKSTICYRITAS